MTHSHIFRQLQDVPEGPYVATVGTFDGVHLGHRALLESAGRRARELATDLLVITFEPYPAQVLRPDTFRGRLSSEAEKLDLLSEDAHRRIVVLPFSTAFAATTAEEFVASIRGAFELLELWVGEEFALGRNRAGTIDALRGIAAVHGFDVHAMERVVIDGRVVSSSRIREHIEAGSIEEANAMLGRAFSISGPVCEGAKLGRTIGFPTANVLPIADLVSLADGIYATTAELDGDGVRRPAMTYIGMRPALNPGPRVIETHLFDFDDDIYGCRLTTRFVSHLRPDANFPNVDALVAQMRVDELHARQVLGGNR